MARRLGIRRLTLLSRLDSDKGVLGALTVNDLFWRTLADVPWRRLPEVIDILAGSVLTSIIVSTLVSMTGLFQLVGLLAQWLLAAYLVFAATPRIYLWTASEITSNNQFRLLTTGVSIEFALALSPIFTLASESWSFPLAGLFLLLGVLLGSAFFGFYFNQVHQWNQLDPSERVDLLNTFIPISDSDRRELVDGFRAGGWRTHFAVIVWKAALVLLCIIPCFLVGIFIDFTLSLYPLLELAVLTGLALNRWSGPLAGLLSAARLTGLEDRLYDSVAYAGRGIKGMTLMILVIVGFMLPVFLFVVVFPLWVRQVTFWLKMLFVPGPFYLTSTIGFILWNQTGVFVCLLLSVGFQLWFWFRMLDRIPYFLDYWERNHNVRAAYATNEANVDDSPLIHSTPRSARPRTRLVGFLLPAVVALLPAMIFIYLNPYPVNELPHLRLHRVFAFSWPVVVVILAVSVWWTAARDSQPIRTDAYALPFSLMIQAGATAVLTSVSRTPEPGALQVGTVWIAPGTFTVFVLLVIPWVFFFEDVGLYARQHHGPGQYADVAYLLSFGGITSVLSILESDRSAVLFLVLAAACFVGGIALGLEKYFYR